MVQTRHSPVPALDLRYNNLGPQPRPQEGLVGSSSRRVPEGEGAAREAPEGKNPSEGRGAKRRCTNEAVGATRPSQFDSRFRLAEAQCFLQHVGRTLHALYGQALHGQMVRDECELTCISRPKPFPALVRIGVMDGPSREIIPARMNQDAAGIRSPATAWPRRTSVPAQSLSMGTPFYGQWWWYRLGCRVPTYLLGVRGRDPPDEEFLLIVCLGDARPDVGRAN